MRAARQSERGAVAALVVIALATLLIFLGVAMDAGHLFSVRGELQNAADAGVLAGVLDLNGTGPRLAVARDAARTFTESHDSDSHVQVTATAVEFGHWAPVAQPCSDFRYSSDPATVTSTNGTMKFCRIAVPGDANGEALAALDVTAVRVQADRETPKLLSAFLGARTNAVGTSAIAVSGAPCHPVEGCVKAPLAIRAGCVLSWTCGGTIHQLGLSAATVNTAGWANIADPDGNVSQRSMCEILLAVKANPDACWNLVSFSDIETGNGGNIHAICGHAPNTTNCELFGQLYDGKTFDLPVISYDSDTSVSCTGPYTGVARVKGFRRFTFVKTHCRDPVACPTFATNSCIDIQLSCDDPPAGPDIGCNRIGAPSPYPPKLVF